MSTPDWTNLPKEHILAQFAAELPQILETAGYNEMYGVELAAAEEGQPTAHTTLLILQKFLRANANDLPKARTQLTEALQWRKTYNPLGAKTELFSREKFHGLGYVTHLAGPTPVVATFNIYGAAAKDPKKTFSDVDAFVRWRVALMELTLSALSLSTATACIPDYGTGQDPYQALQIHDYQDVSFFRQPGEIKTASSKIIELFQRVYPETVSFKYFVNVPLVMQWMMGAMKLVLSSDSVQKMTWLMDGKGLVGYVGEDVPVAYGGKGKALEERGVTTRFEGEGEEEPTVAE